MEFVFQLYGKKELSSEKVEISYKNNTFKTRRMQGRKIVWTVNRSNKSVTTESLEVERKSNITKSEDV